MRLCSCVNQTVQLGKSTVCFTMHPCPSSTLGKLLPKPHPVVVCHLLAFVVYFNPFFLPKWHLLEHWVSWEDGHWPGAMGRIIISGCSGGGRWCAQTLSCLCAVLLRGEVSKKDNLISCISVPSSAVSEAVQVFCHRSFWCGMKLSWLF